MPTAKVIEPECTVVTIDKVALWLNSLLKVPDIDEVARCWKE